MATVPRYMHDTNVVSHIILETQSINLSDFDMLIAAHAVAVDATLVSRDKAFLQVPKRLRVEIW